jgi:hypothetical protein
MTQAYNFPISVNILNHLVDNVLDPDELSTELEDQKIISKNKFLSVLQTLLKVSKQRKSLMITVKKDREQYLCHKDDHDEGDDVTIEIVKIIEPEMLYSLSLEHQKINSIKICFELSKYFCRFTSRDEDSKLP